MKKATETLQHNIERYDSLDGLRTFAAIGIVLMHVLSNGNYGIISHNIIYEFLIPSFTDFVFLFMMLSGFSMCCGYYEKVRSGKITLEQFYAKRFRKIWPFFAVLTALNLVISPSISSMYEAFANLTLCFGLLPNAKIEVIGVGWTLGVIFVFYLLFPFFCYLLADQKRAWLSFGVTFLLQYVCTEYFFDESHMLAGFSGRSNILYCAAYFVAGGLIYLYREKLIKYAKRCRWILSLLILCGLICYAMFERTTLGMLLLFAMMIIYAIGRQSERGLLNNPITCFISGISMELYLCHMVAYRVIEKMGLLRVFKSDEISFWTASLLTIVGAIVFTMIVRWGISKAQKIISDIKRVTK